MQYEAEGKLMRGTGGLYEVLLADGAPFGAGRCVAARAKGVFRHEAQTLLTGDLVRVGYDEQALSGASGQDGGSAVVLSVLPRKNALIRPPMANLDLMLIAFAAARPAPVTETVDKLISIAEFNHIEPVPVIGKKDIDPEKADELLHIYRDAGFCCFALSAGTGEGVDALRAYLKETLPGKTAAIAGASGVGKSTLLNLLYPGMGLETGEISRRTARGRHTTRRVELYPADGGFLADTPGFSMLDFVRFDFFTREDLPLTMREFAPYLGQCRYTKCTHTKEQGCAVLAAVRAGKIAPSRHAGFLSMYEDLKDKHEWSKKSCGH